jgi:hypothetical protein
MTGDLSPREREVLTVLAAASGSLRPEGLALKTGLTRAQVIVEVRRLIGRDLAVRKDGGHVSYYATVAGRMLAGTWKPAAPARITWTEGRHASYRGHAGSLELFSVSWHTQRDTPDWSMRCVLPGLSHKTWQHDDWEQLKGVAEHELAAWLTRVNGGQAWPSS